MKAWYVHVAALMRFNRPIGILLVLWPAWWGLAFAMGDAIPWYFFFLFLVGAVLVRSAGCVINDIFDRHLDAQVARTKERPLASGVLSLKVAIFVLLLLLTMAFTVLLSFNVTTILLGIMVVVPIFIYPLMKRITYWPQLFLGITINWGVLMGWSALHNGLGVTALLVYCAALFWTLGYDTIYAHQDKDDDILIGVKSTALALGNKTVCYVSLFYSFTILLLLLAGLSIQMGELYYVILAFAAIQLIWQVQTVQLDSGEDCWRKFISNQYFGALIFIASVLGVLFRL